MRWACSVLVFGLAAACAVEPAPGVERPYTSGQDAGGALDASAAGSGGTGGTGGDGTGGGGSGGNDDDAGSDEAPVDAGPNLDGGPDAQPDSGAADDDPDACPGRIVELSGSPLMAIFVETSAEFTATAQPSPVCSSTSGAEAVYRLHAPETGILRVTMDTPSSGATFAPQLYVRSPSCSTGLQLGCDSRPSAFSNAVVELPVSAGVDYYFFADQALGAGQGAFTLTFQYL